MPVVVVVLAVVVVVAGLAVSRLERGEQARRRRLVAWARHREWAADDRPAPGPPWTARLPGRNRDGVTLVLSGPVDDVPVTVSEYWYRTRQGRGSTAYRLVVVLVRLPEPYPAIEVAERGTVSRLARSVFGEGHVEAGDAAFDERFTLRSAVPATARALVGPALVAAHLAGRVPLWQLDGDELMTFREGQLRDPDDEIEQLVRPLLEVARLIGR